MDDAELRIAELERAQDQDAIRIHELSSALETEIEARHTYELVLAEIIKTADRALADNLNL